MVSLLYPQDILSDLKEQVKLFVGRTNFSRRDLERLVGRLNFVCLWNPVGKIRLKTVNTIQTELERRYKRDVPIPIFYRLVDSLKYWIDLKSKDS